MHYSVSPQTHSWACKVDLMGRQLPTETLGRLDQTEDGSHVGHERGDGER